MSLFKEFKSRQIQKKAYAFIESLKNKSEKQIEQLYLDNKEFENNEIVLSYLFFNHTSLIRILPVDFQITMLNSNLTMFDFGSTEAKRKLVSSWLHGNKFFMNALVVGFDEEEYSNYIEMKDDFVSAFKEQTKSDIDEINTTGHLSWVDNKFKEPEEPKTEAEETKPEVKEAPKAESEEAPKAEVKEAEKAE